MSSKAIFSNPSESSSIKPFPACIAIALVVLFALPSLFAYGPWKPDEPYVMGTIYSYMQTGDWVVPTLGGEPFLEKPPLFLWVAAGFAKIMAPWLPIEYGARFAIAFFMLITSAAVALTARRFWGAGAGRYAVVLLLAQIGLAQHGRMLVSDVSLLTGCAMALYGFSLIRLMPNRGGAVIGSGVGVAFLSKGLLGLGFFAVLAILLPLLPVAGVQWRTRAYLRGLFISILAMLPWLLVWPCALYMRSEALFDAWFWQNNVGRFFGFSVKTLGATHEKGHLLDTIPWFTFPALPLALWSVWRARRQLAQNEALQICVVLSLVMLATFGVSASGRVVYLMPLLLPIALLAAPIAQHLPARLDRPAFFAAMTLFSCLLLLLCSMWIALVASADLPALAWIRATLHGLVPNDFTMRADAVSIMGALLFIVAWCWQLRKSDGANGRSIIAWCGGSIAVWGAALSLLLPLIDAEKSYQAGFSSLNKQLPRDANCIASVGLGESERGVLHMVSGQHTLRREIDNKLLVMANGSTRNIVGRNCDLLIVQGKAGKAMLIEPELGWHMLWTGTRRGEKQERFWLYGRQPVVTDKPSPMASTAAAMALSPNP